MIQDLLGLGMPLVWAGLIAGGYIIGKEAWSLLRTQRQSAYEAAVARTLADLDARLEKFYLPLRERLKVTKHIFDVMHGGNVQVSSTPIGPRPTTPGIYIESSNPRVFTELIERDVLLPLNREIVKMILGGLAHRDAADTTNYGRFIYHYYVWNALSEACNKGEIQRFSAVEVVDFPGQELDTFLETCDRLLRLREAVRGDLLSFRSARGRLKKANKAGRAGAVHEKQ